MRKKMLSFFFLAYLKMDGPQQHMYNVFSSATVKFLRGIFRRHRAVGYTRLRKEELVDLIMSIQIGEVKWADLRKPSRKRARKDYKACKDYKDFQKKNPKCKKTGKLTKRVLKREGGGTFRHHPDQEPVYFYRRLKDKRCIFCRSPKRKARK